MAFGDLRKRPNILLIISDQQSERPYWPEGWEEEHLPAMRRLRANGISFSRGHTNSCTCSPSRTTLFTGLYPAQHNVLEVLEFDNMSSIQEEIAEGVENGGLTAQQINKIVTGAKERRQRGLASGLQNMAKMLKTAGYNVIYKGKWHLTKPVQFSTTLGQKYWTVADQEHIAKHWGFDGWSMPDAGDNLAVPNMGGGRTNNDGRFVDGNGESAKYGNLPRDITEAQSVCRFLDTYDSDKPFCLIVSLVNPHDVLAYPGTAGSTITVDGEQVPRYIAAGYKDEDFADLPIEPPPTATESLDTKPRAQAEFRILANAGNGIITESDVEKQQRYCQFYAYLCRQVDLEIMKVLERLDANNLTDDTVIFRISDHGDMAMSHGLQRQKMYNVYRETLNVPFIISNPILFPNREESDALVSLVDIMPTLATIAGVPEQDQWVFKGHDLTPLLDKSATDVQDYIHFTYDDLYFYVPSPNHIRCISEKDWKYAVYFDIYDGREAEYELYDLRNDPLETQNLAYPSVLAQLTPQQQEAVKVQRQRMHDKLTEAMQTLGTTPEGIVWPKISGVDLTASTDLPRHSPYAEQPETTAGTEAASAPTV